MSFTSLGTMESGQAAELITRMRWLKIPSKVRSTKIQGLYSVMGEQHVILGVFTDTGQHRQVQYATKPNGARACLILNESTEVEVKLIFNHMVSIGLVAAVFLSPEEAPPLPSIIEVN